MAEKLADQFINQYSVSKTLRFELKPVGRTKEYIERDGIIDTDTKRAQDYKVVKGIIDEYHKAFIEETLSCISLSSLEAFYKLYAVPKRTDSQEKEFEKVQESLRKEIVAQFKNSKKFSRITKKELIKEDLIPFVKNEDEKLELVKGFSEFTTYFTGFHQNRENMYSPDAKSTAIGYRVVHQNLPKYIDNMKILNAIKNTILVDSLEELEAVTKCQFGVNLTLSDCMEINGFNKAITQSGIDAYNTLVGGYSKDNGDKIQGVNELINLYNQKNSDDVKIPKLKPLFKQILSDRDTVSFVPIQYESDKEVFDSIDEAYAYILCSVLANEEELNIADFVSKFDNYDWSRIYISNDTTLTSLSQSVYGNWAAVNQALAKVYEANHPIKKQKLEKYYEKQKKELDKVKYYSVGTIEEVMESYGYEKGIISSYYAEMLQTVLGDIEEKYALYQEIDREEFITNKKLSKSQNAVSVIKSFLDSLKHLQVIIKQLAYGQNIADKDELFYVDVARYMEALDSITFLYNRVRNYVTQKPYSEEKVKLTFGKSTLLAGWDKNKETDNLGVLFRKDGKYYLGIINRNNSKVLENAPECQKGDWYEKVDYKLLPSPSKMLPKVFFSKSRIDEFAPSDEILKIREMESFKKGDKFNKDDCHTFIDFYKASIAKHSDWSRFGFVFSETSSYEDISGFYREVENQGYKISFRKLDKGFIDELVESGQLYLFQIYNKDFSEYSKGKPNLHTMYWRMLFDEDNLNDVVYKLNGEAEIFYRKASIKDSERIVHPANQAITNKDPLDGKKESCFAYDLIKDKRYTIDKFQFHVPITMNFKAQGGKRFNSMVNAEISKGEDICVIGIDRGERNLLFVSVIDSKGNILKQMSLNEIISCDGNNIRTRNYHSMLDKRENENKAARQNWTTVNTIKELKEGYLSQVIHVISKLMIEYNAIVVLEDLNFGFKRGRQKFEKQVYQKFEKMLIDKLNYYVDKDKSALENGGVLRAYQLTDKFTSFQALGKQSGFLYYVPAWNTSKIDPTTGFVNLFSTKYESVEKTKDFISKFNRIYFDPDEQMYAFDFDYSEFTQKAEGTKDNWIAYTNGERIHHYRDEKKNNEWSVEYVNLTDRFKWLFEKNGIDSHIENLKNSILDIESTDFYKEFMYLFGLLVQMRNSDEEEGIDTIISPVKNRKGEFFKTGDYHSIPADADANGAYNIAKKGLLLIEKIKKEDDTTKVKLAISNKEWMQYAQENVL